MTPFRTCKDPNLEGGASVEELSGDVGVGSVQDASDSGEASVAGVCPPKGMTGDASGAATWKMGCVTRTRTVAGT